MKDQMNVQTFRFLNSEFNTEDKNHHAQVKLLPLGDAMNFNEVFPFDLLQLLRLIWGFRVRENTHVETGIAHF